LSMALSRSAMNTVGDIGSPCLVPLLVANQLPSCPHTLTAATAEYHCRRLFQRRYSCPGLF